MKTITLEGIVGALENAAQVPYDPVMGGHGGGKAGIVAAAIALVAAGCADAGPPDPTQVTGLHFTASPSLPANPAPDVDITLDDAVPAQAIYRSTLALPEMPSSVIHCPIGFGVLYRMDFMSGASVAVTVTASPGDCRKVTIPGTTVRRVIEEKYWIDLAQNLGIPESVIYPEMMP